MVFNRKRTVDIEYQPARLRLTGMAANYLKALAASQARFEREVERLGLKIEKELVIPICKKHGLKFTQGMGMFFFTDKKGRDYADVRTDRHNERVARDLEPVFEVLNAEVRDNQVLGYYVGDVR